MDYCLGRSVLQKVRNDFGVFRSRDLSFAVAHTGETERTANPVQTTADFGVITGF